MMNISRALFLAATLSAALAACARAQHGVDAQKHSAECVAWDSASDRALDLAASPLPPVDPPHRTWDALRHHAMCAPPSTHKCAQALHDADQWWNDVRHSAQTLFTADEAPDAEMIRQWTLDRQRFFEQWLATPRPVFVMQHGVFVLSQDVAHVFVDWARCANDRDAHARWKQRGAQADTAQ